MKANAPPSVSIRKCCSRYNQSKWKCDYHYFTFVYNVHLSTHCLFALILLINNKPHLHKKLPDSTSDSCCCFNIMFNYSFVLCWRAQFISAQLTLRLVIKNKKSLLSKVKKTWIKTCTNAQLLPGGDGHSWNLVNLSKNKKNMIGMYCTNLHWNILLLN